MEVSPVEQNTIDCEYLVYFKPKIYFFAHENMEKLPAKVADNQPIIQYVLSTGPKPAQISISPCATSIQ